MNDRIENRILKKYELVRQLGRGAYGIVWLALDRLTKRRVALKKVVKAFYNQTDAQRTYREIVILDELKQHSNIVKLINVIKAENNMDIYLVFEFMKSDLNKVIRSKLLKNIHIKYIVYQMVKALLFIHSAGIVHRDLKPANILINKDCLIKIADFGMARSISNRCGGEFRQMTEDIATRWYKAPEITLGNTNYGYSVDVWSLGCIVAELVNYQPLFMGKSAFNQIEIILNTIGKPDKADISDIGNKYTQNIINCMDIRKGRPFESYINSSDKQLIDFIRQCLMINPTKRMTVEEALQHPYLSEFNGKEKTVLMQRHVAFTVSDDMKLSTDFYRRALYNHIVKRKKRERLAWRAKVFDKKETKTPKAVVPKEAKKSEKRKPIDRILSVNSIYRSRRKSEKIKELSRMNSSTSKHLTKYKSIRTITTNMSKKRKREQLFDMKRKNSLSHFQHTIQKPARKQSLQKEYCFN